MNNPNLKEGQAKSCLIMALILTYEDYVAATHTNRMIQSYQADKERKSQAKPKKNLATQQADQTGPSLPLSNTNK